MADVVNVEVHRSVGFDALMGNLAESLLSKRLPASFLYRGVRSAALWERLHRAHAPSTQPDALTSPHREAFRYLVKKTTSPFHLISLGCGLAEKEMILLELDGARAQEVDLLDGSVELVAEAKRRWLLKDQAARVRGIAMDLAIADEWGDLVSKSNRSTKVFTLFGMVPNFAMDALLSRLSGIVRSGDWLVLDANLRPPTKANGQEIPSTIVSQYDNLECRDWLM